MKFSGHLWNVLSTQWELWLARCPVFLSRVWPIISWVHSQLCSKSPCITGSHSCLSLWPSDSECSPDLWGCPILSWPYSRIPIPRIISRILIPRIISTVSPHQATWVSLFNFTIRKKIQNNGGIMGSPPWFLLCTVRCLIR